MKNVKYSFLKQYIKRIFEYTLFTHVNKSEEIHGITADSHHKLCLFLASWTRGLEKISPKSYEMYGFTMWDWWCVIHRPVAAATFRQIR